jgi:hypothetical protein
MNPFFLDRLLENHAMLSALTTKTMSGVADAAIGDVLLRGSHGMRTVRHAFSPSLFFAKSFFRQVFFSPSLCSQNLSMPAFRAP